MTRPTIGEMTSAQASRKRKKVRRFVKTRVASSIDGLRVHLVGYRIRNPLNDTIHWGEKGRMKDLFAKAVRETDRPLAVRTLTFIRWYPPRSKPFDGHDNLRASFKWFCDAACEWLGLPSDDADCGVKFEYEQHPSEAYGVTLVFK